MKTFKVNYKEVILHEFYVDAETNEDAIDKFCEMASNGELDFSNGWVAEGDIVNITEE